MSQENPPLKSNESSSSAINRPEKRYSQIAYFADQKGRFHEPQEIVVPHPPTEEALQEIETANKLEREATARLLSVLMQIQNNAEALRRVWNVLSAGRDYMHAIGTEGLKMDEDSDNLDDLIGSLISSDEKRRQAHDALIGQLKAYDGYIEQMHGNNSNKAKLYPVEDATRGDIGAWGIALAKAAFTNEEKLKPFFKKISTNDTSKEDLN
ncbi:MAG: hypothetical protein ABIB04_00095 [Patescibacteria group bacterium]